MNVHPKKILTTIAFVLLLAAGGAFYPTNAGSSSPASSLLRWIPRSSMPASRYYFGAALGGDGNIYIVGGDNYTNIPTNPLNVVEAYNPETNSWTTRAPLPTPRWRLGAAAGSNGRIYAIGGANRDSTLSTIEEYDPQTDTWVAKTNMPTPRAELGVVASSGRIFALGGWNESGALAVVEGYNPSTDTWMTYSNMPFPKYGFGVGAANNGKIYVFGGSGANNTAYEFDPNTDTWTTLAPMPTGRAALMVTEYNGELFAVGGVGGGEISGTVEVYNPNANSWEPQTSLLTPRANFGLVAAGNGALYAIGGWGPGGSPGYGGDGALATAEAAGLSPTPVAIDILPGQVPNAIEPASPKILPVAVLTTEAFDAAEVDPATVRFGPGQAAPRRGTGELKDTDHDGDLDLLFSFRVPDTGIQCGDETASLFGFTYEGDPVEGTDTILTVRCR